MARIDADNSELRARGRDLVIVVALLATSQLEIWWPAFPISADPAAEPLWAAALCEAALIVPLVARLRYPVLVVFVVMAALVLQYALIEPAETLTALVALVVALQGGVVHARRRSHAWIAAALGMAGSLALVPWIGQDAVFVAVVSACALFTGAALRERHDHLELLRSQALQLERERAEREQAMIMDERIRIARELHDLVAHHVSVMVLQAGAARHLLSSDAARATTSLLDVERMGREAVDGMRLLLGILRAPDPEGGGLDGRLGIARIGELADQVRALGLGVHVSIDAEGDRDLPDSIDISAYRIVQEALTNALRHAESAARVDVVVRRTPSQLEIQVVDDGTARDIASERRDGNGILGMRERAALFGGSLYAGPRGSGQGFVVHAVLPIVEVPA